MDDISGDDERDLQSGLLHGDLLHEVYVLELEDIQEASDASVGDVLDQCWRECLLSVGPLLQLSQFLLEGHDGEKEFDGDLYVFFCFDVADHFEEVQLVDAFVFEAL